VEFYSQRDENLIATATENLRIPVGLMPMQKKNSVLLERKIRLKTMSLF
jgi:hypothetical protein